MFQQKEFHHLHPRQHHHHSLIDEDSSRPIQITRLASRPHSSSRRPPQAKAIRVDLQWCESELFEKDLVEIRSRYMIPSTVMLVRPRSTDRTLTPPSRLRTFFEVALRNGMCLHVHPYIRTVLSMPGIGLAQLTPNMWFSIVRFDSACLLAGVNPTGEFFLTSFSQRTQKDRFLYFTAKCDVRGFCEAFPSKVEPDHWRPYFLYVTGDSFPPEVPSDFREH
ncbi:hypothetical protein LIER_05431 [Lithospermum erythrorhizon]|uniref:Transposase (putative) gypsy type domain-containing protein n=1 Tax=Lithospermum erythrorhizon TaxID=34254 RepID=A0AAV3P0N9_LITER